MKNIAGMVISLGLIWSVSLPHALADGKNKAVCESCNLNRVTPVQAQGKSIEALAKAIQCSQPVQSKAECAQDFLCNLGRSAATIGTLGLNQYVTQKMMSGLEENSKSRECRDFRRNDCVGEAVSTFIKDVAWNGQGIVIMGKFLAWDAPKGAAKGAVKGLKWAGNKVLDWYDNPALEMQKLEDGVSKFSRWAKNMNADKIAMYYNNTKQFMADLAKTIYAAVDKFIQDNFGCEQWAGAPHVSKCLKPWEGLACADCNTRINRVCGIGTLIATEGALVGLGWTKGGVLVARGAAAMKGAAEASGLLARGGQAWTKIAELLKYPRQLLAKAAKRVSEVTGIHDIPLTGAEAKAARAAKAAKKAAKVSKGSKTAKAEKIFAKKSGLKATKTENAGATATAEAAKTDAVVGKVAAKEDTAAQAAAHLDDAIDFKKIDTSYIDEKMRDSFSKKYRPQGRMQQKDYFSELKTAFMEDEGFANLCGKGAVKCTKQDDIIYHLLNRMEQQAGGKVEKVKADIEKILNSCGWAPPKV